MFVRYMIDIEIQGNVCQHFLAFNLHDCVTIYFVWVKSGKLNVLKMRRHAVDKLLKIAS